MGDSGSSDSGVEDDGCGGSGDGGDSNSDGGSRSSDNNDDDGNDNCSRHAGNTDKNRMIVLNNCYDNSSYFPLVDNR